MKTRLIEHVFGDTLLRYRVCEQTGRTGLEIIPATMAGQIAARRDFYDGPEIAVLPENWPDFPAWDVDSLVQDGIPGLKLAYRSPDGEEGYPGNVDAFVTYLLSDDDEVIIRYEATTDRATPLSLTNHSYFNLAGEGSGSIEGQSLQIFSEETAATDPSMTLLGKRLSVVGEVTDFRQTKKLGDSIPLLMNAHGDNYFFRRNARRTPELVARMSDSASGRVMEVSTTEDCMQVYTAAFMDGTLRGKCGQTYEKHSGLALECQGYPDGVSHPELGDIILRPGETYRQTTIYKFATE